LFVKYRQKLDAVPTVFVRDFIHEVDWGNRFIGVKGSRGVGKTTLLLQYAKLRLPAGEKSLYVSLDDFYCRRLGCVCRCEKLGFCPLSERKHTNTIVFGFF
jgi:predicted AAA+ superfamily ATPase